MRKIKSSVVLVSIILFHLITTFAWLTIDKSYLKLDAWRNYRYTLEVYNFLKGIPHSGLPFYYIEPQTWHGILVGFITAPFLFIFGFNQDMAIMVNSTIFLSMLVFSTYGIGKRLSTPQSGILAAFILTMYPIISNNLRLYMLDLPLASMVTTSLYLLIASENFRNKKYALLFGLSFMLGLLIKFNYLAFIIGPLIFALYKNISQKKQTLTDILKKSIYALIIIFLLYAVFYGIKAREILLRIYTASVLGALTAYKMTFQYIVSAKIRSLLEFTEFFIYQGISFFMLTVFLISLPVFYSRKIKHKAELCLVMLIPLFAHVFLFANDGYTMLRYSIPFLPVLALITAIGLCELKHKAYKVIVISLVIVFGLLQFLAVSYGVNFMPQRISLTIPNKLRNFKIVPFQQTIEVPPFLEDKNSHPTSLNWKGTEALNSILESNISGKRIKIISLSYIPELFETMDYLIVTNRRLIDFMPITVMCVEKFYDKRYAKPDTLCMDSDYVIIADNTNSIWEKFIKSGPGWEETIEKARSVFNRNIKDFQVIKTIPLPDHSVLSIYKNIRLGKNVEIRDNDIKLCFDSGRIRIYYKEVEITKGLGLYTSLFSLQHWRDSMEAKWEVKKARDNRLLATGRWLFIPIIQEWDLELKDNILAWEVKTRAEDIIKIEKEDFKLMLSDKYKTWNTSSNVSGEFPASFKVDTWEKLWAGTNDNKVGVVMLEDKNTHLPAIRFNASKMPPPYTVSIENSDQLFNGRVIGCFKNNAGADNIFDKTKTEYFQAEISIE